MGTSRIKAAVLGVGPLVVLMGALSQGSGECGTSNPSGVTPSCTPTPGPTTTATPSGSATASRTATPSHTVTPSRSATTTATPTPTRIVAIMGQESDSLTDGLTVSTSEPTWFAPSETAAGLIPGGKNVVFDVTILNGSRSVKGLSAMTVTVDSAVGAGKQIFDSAQDIGGASGLSAVAPGQSDTVRVGFSLPAAATSIDVDVQPLTDGEFALFIGYV